MKPKYAVVDRYTKFIHSVHYKMDAATDALYKIQGNNLDPCTILQRSKRTIMLDGVYDLYRALNAERQLYVARRIREYKVSK